MTTNRHGRRSIFVTTRHQGLHGRKAAQTSQTQTSLTELTTDEVERIADCHQLPDPVTASFNNGQSIVRTSENDDHVGNNAE
jgi:hypothetical protein